MYNRILKRPMFRRGGPSFSAQGTGITSPFDTPRTIGGGAIRGNPMGNRIGFAEPEVNIEDFYVDNTAERLKAIGVEKDKIFAPKEGEWSSDVMQYLSALSNPYKESGEVKTIGEMGYEGAEQVRLTRDERQEKQDLAALSGIEAREELLLKQQEQKADLATRKTIQELANTGAINVAEIQNSFEKTATGGMIREIKNRKDLSQKEKHKMIEAIILKSNRPQLIINLAKAIMDNASAAMEKMDYKDAMEQATNAIMLMMVDVGYPMARGGRVGYQMGTPDTGAMPVQARATEQIVTPNADITETETVTEGQQPTVQMPYQEFRAAIPAEVSDEIVQLIYYNEDAFADFSQITSQADVYAFNNKYGVSLVLPMDTETT